MAGKRKALYIKAETSGSGSLAYSCNEERMAI